MKKLLLTLFLLINFTIVFAQTTTPAGGVIKGTVIDSAKNSPLSYATISVIDADTKQPVKSTYSKDNGGFEIRTPALKVYTVNVVSVGYRTKTFATVDLKTAKEGAINLGNILLAASNNQLGEVQVTAAKPLVKQEIDRVSYDVQADPESKVNSAMDMLRKLPLISVDGDDNIQLQGSSSYRIFINGKPSALLAANPKDVLRSMPANTILKIEVITTPPAKYDAEGLAGIINIITTRSTQDGYNGTLTLRDNNRWGPSANLTGTYKQGKFGVSGYIGTGHQNVNDNPNSGVRTTFNPFTTLDQQGDNIWGGNYAYGSFDLSYEIDTLNLLTSSVNLNHGDFTQSNNYYTQFYDANDVLQQSYHLYNDGKYNWRGTDVSLNYQRSFAHQAGRLLTFSYRYSYNSNLNFSNLTTLQAYNYNLPDYDQSNTDGSKEHTLQLDYVHPVKKLNIEAGAKAILRTNFSDYETNNLDATTGDYVPDPTRSDIFHYHQNVFAAYNSYTLKLTNYTFKAGLRVEHTHVDADFTNTNTILDMDYNSFIPSVSIMRSFKGNNSLTFGFTNRLERPGIWQLNPFVDRSNPRSLSSGNDKLDPVLSHILELTYTKSGKGTFSAKFAYSFVNNNIQSVTQLLSDTVSLSTYANVGRRHNTGVNFSFNYPITPKVSVTVNQNIRYLVLEGEYNDQFYRNEGWLANGNGSLTYKVNDSWRFAINGGYSSPYLSLQGRQSNWIYSSASANFTFWKKNATLSFNTNNPYQDRRIYHNNTTTSDFIQNNYYSNIYRTFSLGFSYKFGRLSSDIKKNQRGINNDDVSSGGGKSN